MNEYSIVRDNTTGFYKLYQLFGDGRKFLTSASDLKDLQAIRNRIIVEGLETKIE